MDSIQNLKQAIKNIIYTAKMSTNIMEYLPTQAIYANDS